MSRRPALPSSSGHTESRDYADVSPPRGVYHGAPAEAITVSVEITRVS